MRLAKGPGATRHHPGVTQHDIHRGHVDAQLIGADLRQNSAVGLTGRRRAGVDGDPTIGKDAHGGALERAKPRALDIIANTDPDIAAFGPGGGLAGFEIVVTGAGQSPSLGLGIIAGIINHRRPVAIGQPHRIGHIGGGDKIAIPHRRRIKGQFASD